MTRKSITLLSICCLAAFLSMIVYYISDAGSEKAIPVVNTLSSEHLLALGYNDTTTAYNDDIWEDNDFSYSRKNKEQETSSVPAASFPLDINIASADELMQIKGIGSATAENIISYRNSHGYFCSVDELLNVDGIGSKKLSDMKGYIYVDPEIIKEASETTADDDFFSETSLNTFPDQNTEAVASQISSENITRSYNIPETDIIFPIELNTASAEELMSIDGVGKVIAEAIVEYAHSTGFNDKSDLLNVPGIGEKRFESISPYVYVE